MFQQKEDTIVAPATLMGHSAIALIRLSGTDAIDIADTIFTGRKKLKHQAAYKVAFGKIVNAEGKIIDEVLATVFRAPNSYTGENSVEISTHGSPIIIQEVIQMCLDRGARLAVAGEFTLRAFLNGKMDLTQAEAVADLIHSESEAAHNAAINQMRGGFSKELSSMREELINFTALIELELDFAEEDVEFANRDQLKQLVEKVYQKTRSLIASFRLGNAVKNGIRVAIIGKPNAGKSTLLNLLLNEERAIVSDIPGTTRDSIEETLMINGILFRLIDTAGIRNESVDTIENLGIERSKKNAESADVVIHVTDLTDPRNDDEGMALWLKKIPAKVLKLYNKSDVYEEMMKKQGTTFTASPYYISAKDPAEADRIKALLYEVAMPEVVSSGQSLVTNVRHVEALQKMEQSLEIIRSGLEMGTSGDLLSVDIRRTLYYLGSITGQVEVDRDILGTIFGKFCIGK